MSFFDKIFGEKATESPISKVNWIPLESISELDDITLLSNTKTVLIFKHSTRCSISRMVLRQFEREFDFEESITPYLLDLLVHRNISNEIATRFAIEHQSPQIIVIKDGKVMYNASHESIVAERLKPFS